MSAAFPAASANPRRGKRFEPVQELHLRDAALTAIASLTRTGESVTTVAEAAGPFGIPDLVMMIDRRGLLERRIELNIPPVLNEIDAGITSALSDKRPITVNKIAHILQWPTETIERKIVGLVRRGIAIRYGPRSFLRPSGLGSLDEIIAIEMKVGDWKRGIHQCRRYAIWADRYVLVMDSVPDNRLAEVANEVSFDGAGLFVDGHWVVRPRRGRTVRKSRSLWASEHMVAALDHQFSPTP